jgi:hypothetical protein
MKLTFHEAKIVGKQLRPEGTEVTELELKLAGDGPLSERIYWIRVPGNLGKLGDLVRVDFSTVEQKAKASAN